MAFRRKLGALIAAFNSPTSKTGYAIGFNQYSFDFDKFVQYLEEVGGSRLVAGDYKAFDQHYVSLFRDAAYRIVGNIAKRNLSISDNAWNFFVDHQTKTPVQINDVRVEYYCTHCSGCLLTTIINCVTNELYFRYIFKLVNPTLCFDRCVRAWFLGDDHVLSIRDGVDFGQNLIAEKMPLLNQVYTDDLKNLVSDFDYRPVEKVTFLGAVPMKYKGRYVGALRKDTLESGLVYCKAGSLTQQLDAASTYVRMAAMHGREYYNDFRRRVEEALKDCEYEPFMPYESARESTANATAGSFVDGGYEVCYWGEGKSEGPSGLVTLTNASEVTVASHPVEEDTTTRALGEPFMPLTKGLDTKTLRFQRNWTPSQSVGTQIWSASSPYELLETQTTSLQNMPFDRFYLWKGSVEVTVQLNGQPFQAGYLVLYYIRLGDDTNGANVRATEEHVLLNPGKNNTATLRVPFAWFREMMPLRKTDEHPLGWFHLKVFSQLVSPNDTPVSVSIYTRFPSEDQQFSLPAPAPVSEQAIAESSPGEILTPCKSLGSILAAKRRNVLLSLTSSRALGGFESGLPEASTEGRKVVESKKDGDDRLGTILDAAGSVLGVLPGPMAKAAGLACRFGAEFLKLDDTPVSAGTIPIAPQIPSMATTNGPKTMGSMQMDPGALYLNHRRYFDPNETKIDYLCSRWGVIKRFSWSVDQSVGHVLHEFPLNSALTDAVISNDFPLFLAVLNRFVFWRSDIELEIRVARTPYQSGRLRVTLAFGTPWAERSSIDPAIQVNFVLDFTGDTDAHTITIPWNSVNQWLRTNGNNIRSGTESESDISLGVVRVDVVNPLVVQSDLVGTNVEVILSARCKPGTVHVAVPTALPCVAFNSSGFGAVLLQAPQPTAEGAEGETISGGGEETLGGLPLPGENVAPDPVASATVDPEPAPNTVANGLMFPYEVTDINDLCRRMVPMTLTTGLTANPVIRTGPFWDWNALYGGWGGSFRWRIFAKHTAGKCPISYFPTGDLSQSWNAYPGRSGVLMNQTTSGTGSSVEAMPLFPSNVRLPQYCPPLELPYGFNGDYLDFSTPFQVNLKYLATPALVADDFPRAGIPRFSGYVSTTSAVEAAYVGAGDDFSYGIFHPPEGCYWFKPVTIGASVANPSGWLVGNHIY